RRHTRFDCDWSSDVCSSDLPPGGAAGPPRGTTGVPPLFALVGGWPVVGGGKVEPCAATVDEVGGGNVDPWVPSVVVVLATVVGRSEERRVGKECRCRWRPDP